ncbi:hypothetical protein HK102_012639, partial [Quaeritorhiza haematococci]
MPTCKTFYDELLQCLLASDCVLVHRNTVKECLDKKHNETVPNKCRLAQQAYIQ